MKFSLDELRALNEQFNQERMWQFRALGDGGQYNKEQREYAFEQIDEYGIRATAKMLKIPRRTLQRWCRKYDYCVVRCPSWVYDWAERRRKKREFWAMRGSSKTTNIGPL